ncbi:uncharacterized protein N7529_001612 [Penicillium soppii]|uniref:uncharacterized protein n=1 Tax=Penicillium soppii TaxID=69789 RepID=UPI00254965F5|nr:uncharacterized protein N7529_001612 [Penicillium soppii]KAJ5876028.1 hypothetical protein N7529_001612 [Penicillium soppii]
MATCAMQMPGRRDTVVERAIIDDAKIFPLNGHSLRLLVRFLSVGSRSSSNSRIARNSVRSTRDRRRLTFNAHLTAMVAHYPEGKVVPSNEGAGHSGVS